MKRTKTNQISQTDLSEAEWLKKRAASERTLAVLKAKLRSLSTQERQALIDRGIDAVRESVKKVMKKLARMPEIKVKTPGDVIRINVGYHHPHEAFALHGEWAIEWATAERDTNRITILTVALLAPKEVLRVMAVHEALHLVYAKVETDAFPALPIDHHVQHYPEAHQQEEQWVRDMTKRLGYDAELMEIWEVAIKLRPENWRPLYYEGKRRMPDIKRGAQS